MEVVIDLPAPLEHQQAIYYSPKRRKVARWGRRRGKTRFAFTAGVAGHGPTNPETGKPELEGVMQGWDVVWVAQDYPNLITVVWNEIIEPRFAHLPFVETNQNEHRLEFPGLGSLYLRSAEAIKGIRGIGSRLIGVIVDEAAWLDLEAALKDVILATLLDNDGWLILMSTTNGGLDGNAAKRIPSYFNVICEEIRAGKRPEWEEFTGTAADNPTISPAAFARFVSEYEPGTVSYRQEVLAELFVGGGGLSFPSLEKSRHIVEPFKIPKHWPIFGAFDWGFGHPFAFGLFCVDESDHVTLVDSVFGRGLEPPDQAERILEMCRNPALWVGGQPRIPPRVYAGHDCWAERKARGEMVPTIAEEFRGFALTLIRASISRKAGANNCRRYFRWRIPSGNGQTIERRPLFQLMDTVGNQRVWACLTTRVNDPDALEEVLKTDAGENGLGGDDEFDMVRYGLASRPLRAPAPPSAKDEAQDVKSWAERAKARSSQGGETGRGYSVPRSRDLVEMD